MTAARLDPGLGTHYEAPLVSVTVTNYNYARFLPKALDSILAQSFADFELIVIDNASTDDSASIIADYAARDRRIRPVLHDLNRGSLASLRESCGLARGRYRVHVDADDWVISPTAFARQVAILEAHPEVAFVYSSMALFGPDGALSNVSHPYPRSVVLPGEKACEAILSFNITHSGMMVRLDRYRAVGGYPEGYPGADDILLAARLCGVGSVGYIAEPLYAFRQHGQNHHLGGDLHYVTHEMLPIIDEVFSGPLGSAMAAPGAVRRRVTRNALVHGPTQHIFSGRTLLGWRLYWESLKARPRDTLAQRRTLALLARSLVGARGYQRLAASKRRLAGVGR